MILEFLVLLFQLAFSIVGPIVWALGFVTFICLPVIPAVTNRGYKLANFHLWLAVWVLGRAAILVDEHNGTLWKGMWFDDIGVERIKVGGTLKAFEDPAQALHNWMGFPFALADEESGVLFDPRHAAWGARKEEYHDNGIDEVDATETDYNQYKIDRWMPGVFELPKGEYELVDLSKVRSLFVGGERSEYPERVERYWQLSRIALGDNKLRGTLRPLIIAGILFGGLIFMWQLSNFAGGESGGDGGSTVTFGAAYALSVLFAVPALPDYDWKRLTAYGVASGTALLILGGLFVLLGPILFIAVAIFFVLGFTFPLFVLLLFKAAGKGGFFSNPLLKLGLVAYDKPVFVWSQSGYNLREFRELDDVGDVHWYGLKGEQIGFTFEPAEESFGAEHVDNEELERSKEVEQDSSILPDGYVRCPSIKWEFIGGYVPKRIKENKLYINAGIALSRFRDSAMGAKSEQALLRSKDEEGLEGDTGMSDKWFYIGVTLSAIASVAFGTLIFF